MESQLAVIEKVVTIKARINSIGKCYTLGENTEQVNSPYYKRIIKDISELNFEEREYIWNKYVQLEGLCRHLKEEFQKAPVLS